MQTMQRFLKENYQKNLSVKFIHINSVTYLSTRTELFAILQQDYFPLNFTLKILKDCRVLAVFRAKLNEKYPLL